MSSPLVGPPVVKAKTMYCPNCGGPVEFRGFGHALTVVCPQCLSVLDASSPLLKIVQEAQELYDGGAQEILLIAQDTTSYGRDLYGEFRYNKNWKASLTVVNVADRKPPYDSANLRFGVIGTPYDLFTYDDFGRMIDLHVAYSF